MLLTHCILISMVLAVVKLARLLTLVSPININQLSVNTLLLTGKLLTLLFLFPLLSPLALKCATLLGMLPPKIRRLLLAFGFKQPIFVVEIRKNAKENPNQHAIQLIGHQIRQVVGQHSFFQWRNMVPLSLQNLDLSTVLLRLLQSSLDGPNNLVFLTQPGLCGPKTVGDLDLALVDIPLSWYLLVDPWTHRTPSVKALKTALHNLVVMRLFNQWVGVGNSLLLISRVKKVAVIVKLDKHSKGENADPRNGNGAVKFVILSFPFLQDLDFGQSQHFLNLEERGVGAKGSVGIHYANLVWKEMCHVIASLCVQSGIQSLFVVCPS